MSEPMFVSVQGDIWVNVDAIESVSPYTFLSGPDAETTPGCKVTLRSGREYYAKTPARDFLNRMTGVTWK